MIVTLDDGKSVSLTRDGSGVRLQIDANRGTLGVHLDRESWIKFLAACIATESLGRVSKKAVG